MPDTTVTVTYASPHVQQEQIDLKATASYMFMLLFRNITSDGFVVADPDDAGRYSKPGCVIAAPSYPANTPGVDQDYMFNWVRDAAITMIEVVEASRATPPLLPVLNGETLSDYVNFAKACIDSNPPTLGHACFTIDARVRPWSEQNDGPALQIIVLLQAWDLLDAATQGVARDIININLDFLLKNYTFATTSPWEEHAGLSFFARAVQLRAFRDIQGNAAGITVPAGIADAITWLEQAITRHWNGSYYLTLLASEAQPPVSAVTGDPGYDPNIDILCAAIYGAVPVTDTKLLATAAHLRRQWSDPNSPNVYPINQADATLGIGPVLGRYPSDTYDVDTSDTINIGHPWPLCSCNLAEVYYRLATVIKASGQVPSDSLTGDFYAQIGVSGSAGPTAVINALRAAGDRILHAVLYHSDRYELSEQFDRVTGFEKSVNNLTWSYAAYLSAVRARG